jgi:hypothetical protein
MRMERLFAAAALAAVLAVAGCDRIKQIGGDGDGKGAAAGGARAEADSASADEPGEGVSVDTQKIAVDSVK